MNIAMAIISGIFSAADFAECLRIASKLGITDDVLKYVSNGKVSEADIKKIKEIQMLY